MLRLALSALTAAILMCATLGAPARAGDAEIALLAGYVGAWSGEGQLVGGEEPEAFRCRLTVSKGNQSKINYSGRCALVNMNLSVAGTILYSDPNQRYQAVMSSNAGFTGQAVGLIRGERILFDLASQQVDRGGNTIRIGAKLELAENNTITVDFEVEFNNSGEVLTAKVPFHR